MRAFYFLINFQPNFEFEMRVNDKRSRLVTFQIWTRFVGI